MKRISEWIFYNLMKWKLIGDFPPNHKKYVIIVFPHTCWMDFPIGILIKYITNIGEHAKYLAKKSLFKKPFGWFFKCYGGIPVDRSIKNNMVTTVVSEFEKSEELIFLLSPEGTRRKVDKWKTGFYHIAKNANVPIVMVAMDYGKKEVRIAAPFYTTDSMEKDFEFFLNHFEGTKGRFPDRS